MLQHNNNNNYPCLDVAHKELLHGCRRNGTTFSSALGFGAIPLIKGLRAWAVSGGYSRSKRKASASTQPCDLAHLSRLGTSHIKTNPFRTPGVRQGGLGALVTVATLKDSDGGRQTQTQCLFLKAEGCNYLCTVGTKVDRRKAGKGCQDGMGICDSKPVRKWRKSSKRHKSIENIAVVENKEATASAKVELLDKCSITQCLKAKNGLTVFNNDEDQLNRSKFSASHELCEPDTCNSTTKYDLSTEVKEDTAPAFCPKLKKCEVFVGPISSSNCTHKTTEISKNKSDLTADVNIKYVLKSQECPMPNSEEQCPKFGAVMINNNEILSTINHSHSDTTDTFNYKMELLADRNESSVPEELELVSKILSKDINKTNQTLLFISHRHCELNVLTPSTSNHSDETLITVIQEEQKIKRRIDNRSSNHDLETGEQQKSIGSVSNQDMNHLSESAKDHWESTTCFSYNQDIIMEVKMISSKKDRKEDKNTEEDIQMFANSMSQCFDSFKVANAITSSPNPTPMTNATALGYISRQQQEENKGMTLALKPELELLEKQDRVQKEDIVVDEEDEDEFGVFLKAGDEQVWNEGFSELKKGPCEKHTGNDIRNPSFLNNPPSWMSDQSREPSNKQSEDTWTAFTQEVVSRATEKDCWFSTAVGNMHLTDSSAITVTVPNKFLEASTCLKSASQHSDYIPTLTEMLRGSAAENRPEQNGSQNLLDKLQDLDRMIGVKYKVAESLSRKLLLQSLNLRTLNPERAGGRKQNMARFSPNLPTSNRQLAANAKRRLSYDINRNIKS